MYSYKPERRKRKKKKKGFEEALNAEESLSSSCVLCGISGLLFSFSYTPSSLSLLFTIALFHCALSK
jgi:hypothetical protein